MIITNKSTISFKIPEEMRIAARFKDTHPDYKEECTTNFWNFTITKTCKADLEIKLNDE